MRLYNSLSQCVEEFKPAVPGRGIIYVCGLTPYDHAHVGHARTCVAFDTIQRHLAHRGYALSSIQNITDVDDKILRRSEETGENPGALTERFHEEALALLDRLHVRRASVYPKVTEHIPDIIAFIQLLVHGGHAYETATGVYFSVETYREYGKLSGQSIAELKAGARVEIDETKRSPLDFALWKKTAGALIEFDSPWGRGRPGWHIECSAMAYRYAQRAHPAGSGTLDIHGGARDLLFPHHENERAQSEAALSHPLARYWLHTGLVTVDGEKMSKSLGNFVRLEDMLVRFSPNAIRLFFLQTHYRRPIDYNEEALAAAEEGAERVFNTRGLLREEKAKPHQSDRETSGRLRSIVRDFHTSMDNDFDTPNALAALFHLLRATNHHLEGKTVDRVALAYAEKEVDVMLEILGLEEPRPSIEAKRPELNGLLAGLGEPEAPTAGEALNRIIELRERFRKEKEYAASDEIRKKLLGLGIVLEDKAAGVRWKIVAQ